MGVAWALYPSAGATLVGLSLPPYTGGSSRFCWGHEVTECYLISTGALAHLDAKPAPSLDQEAATPGWGRTEQVGRALLGAVWLPRLPLSFSP